MYVFVIVFGQFKNNVCILYDLFENYKRAVSCISFYGLAGRG